MKIRIRPALLAASVTVALALIVVSGLSAGRLTRRWGAPKEHEAAAELLRSLPREMGDWVAKEDVPLEPRARDILQCGDAFLNRSYVNQATSQEISLIVIAGPYGPLSVHNPSVCYPNQGLKTVEGPMPVTVSDASGLSGDFFRAVFSGSGLEDRPRNVFYAWSRGAKWEIADIPRFAFGGAPVLFKLQVDAGALGEGDTSAKEFLGAFLKAWEVAVSRSRTADDSGGGVRTGAG